MPNKQTRKQNAHPKPRTTSSARGRLAALSGLNVWASRAPKMEAKFAEQRWSNQQLYHNVGTTWNANTNLLDLIVNGNTVQDRIGASIYVKGLDFRFVLNNKADRPNVSYRILVAATPSTTAADVFHEIVWGGVFTGTHLPTQSVLLYDATFPKNQGSGMDTNATPNKERSFNHFAYVPINNTVTYAVGGICQTRLVGYVICYDAFGTLTTDNIASVAQASLRIDFADP